MFKIVLFIVLIFFMLFLLLGVSFLRGLKNLFFGGSNRDRQNRQRQYNEQQSDRRQNRQQPNNSASRKKIFTKDVGEYVDYEEVKEDKTDSPT